MVLFLANNTIPDVKKLCYSAIVLFNPKIEYEISVKRVGSYTNNHITHDFIMNAVDKPENINIDCCVSADFSGSWS